MEDKKSNALELFYKGYNCAQAVACNYAQEMGIGVEEAKRLSEKYASGTYITCGPLLAVIMAVNLSKGNGRPVNVIQPTCESREDILRIEKQFADKAGATACSILRKNNDSDTTQDASGCDACIRTAEDILNVYFREKPSTNTPAF